jgi:hypothetical protein
MKASPIQEQHWKNDCQDYIEYKFQYFTTKNNSFAGEAILIVDKYDKENINVWTSDFTNDIDKMFDDEEKAMYFALNAIQKEHKLYV